MTSYFFSKSPGAQIFRESGLRLLIMATASVGSLTFVFIRVPWLQSHPVIFTVLALIVFSIVVPLTERRRSPVRTLQDRPMPSGGLDFLSEVVSFHGPFHIRARQFNDVVILDLYGKMTLGEGDEILKKHVEALVQRGYPKILLNLQNVPYMDSAGLGEVVRTYTNVSRLGGQVKIINLDKRIQDLLAITKLLTVFDSEEKAIASYTESRTT